jgi:hypothetical protein
LAKQGSRKLERVGKEKKMNKIQILSFLTAVVIGILIALTHINHLTSGKYEEIKNNIALGDSAFVFLQKSFNNRSPASVDDTGMSFSKSPSIEVDNFIERNSSQFSKVDNNDIDSLSAQKLYVKEILSAILVIAALYVILSKKYDSDTQKWAYSVLTLVAGFWLGVAK